MLETSSNWGWLKSFGSIKTWTILKHVSPGSACFKSVLYVWWNPFAWTKYVFDFSRAWRVPGRFISANIRVNSQRKRSATQRDAFPLVEMSIIKDALALAVTSVSKETSYMVWETDKLTWRANCYLFLLVTEENVQIHHLFNYRKILNATLNLWDLYRLFFFQSRDCNKIYHILSAD